MKRTLAVSAFIETAFSSLLVARAESRTAPEDIDKAQQLFAASSLSTSC